MLGAVAIGAAALETSVARLLSQHYLLPAASAAGGLTVDGQREGYRVQIVYTEPEFHRRNPHTPSEYSFTYDAVPAVTPEEAILLVTERFRRLAGLSRVGWGREIKSITILGPTEKDWEPSKGEPF